MITQEQIKYWQELAEKATAGPLVAKQSSCVQGEIFHIESKSDYVAVQMFREDAELFAASRTAVPLLCARVLELEAQKVALYDAASLLLSIVRVQNGNLHDDTNEGQRIAQAALEMANTSTVTNTEGRGQ